MAWYQCTAELRHPFLHKSGAHVYGVALWGLSEEGLGLPCAAAPCIPADSLIFVGSSLNVHFLNVQSPDSTSHTANQTFPLSLPFQAQTSGTSLGVVKNKSYLVNHARFQLFFSDIIMAPLLVLQKTQTTQHECSCSCNQCIYGWTKTSNACIQDWSQGISWLWLSHADYNLHFFYFLSFIMSKIVSI